MLVTTGKKKLKAMWNLFFGPATSISGYWFLGVLSEMEMEDSAEI